MNQALNATQTAEQFSEMAETLAVNLQEDGLLNNFIRLAYRIAEEEDHLKRGELAMIVSKHAYFRTSAFTEGIFTILGTEVPGHV